MSVFDTTSHHITGAIVRRVDHRLAGDDRGPAYTFDIDKTYLQTSFSSLRGLARIPLEMAIDKRPYSGLPELIRACQRGSPGVGADRPVFFISGSPSQMRAVLERRLVLDRIAVDGLTLKDWTKFLRPGRFHRLTAQLPYKLAALLIGRADLPAGSFEILFGDDTESDEEAYRLYAEITAGRARGEALARVLRDAAVAAEDAAEIVALGAALPRLTAAAPVRRIFIHAIKGAPPALPRGDALVWHYQSPLVPATRLFADGLISGAALGHVYRALAAERRIDRERAAALMLPILQETPAIGAHFARDADLITRLDDAGASWPDGTP